MTTLPPRKAIGKGCVGGELAPHDFSHENDGIKYCRKCGKPEHFVSHHWLKYPTVVKRMVNLSQESKCNKKLALLDVPPEEDEFAYPAICFQDGYFINEKGDFV